MFQEWLKDYEKLREENYMSEEEIIDKVMMIDQWKVSGDIYTQDELNAIGELIDLYNKEKALAENHKLAFEKQTENLKEIEDLYNKEKEKNNKALEYIETLEINSIGTTFKYTEIGNEIWKRLKGE